MDSHSVWTAIVLVLIVEGLLPFISPRIWRKTFLQLMQQKYKTKKSGTRFKLKPQDESNQIWVKVNNLKRFPR